MSGKVDPTAISSKGFAGGAALLMAAQIVRIGLTTLSAVVIARLLTPGDYGVIAMVTPIIGFLLLLQDLGLGTAVIQAGEVSADELTAIFWVNMVAACAIALAMVAIAPAVGWFYGDARAGYVTAVGGVGAILGGAALLHTTLLQRDLRFGMVSGLDVANALTSFIVAALLAAWWRNYWALVFGTIAGSAVQVVLVWMAVSWRPTTRFHLHAARRFAKFGGDVTGFNILNYFVRNGDNVLIAKIAGSVPLGLYDRSYKLMMMPLQTLNTPLWRLLMPVLSRQRDDPDRYRRTFVVATRALTLAALPGIAVTTALAGETVTLLLGERWAAAGPIFFWLGLAGLMQPLGSITGVLFMSSGRTGPFLRWGIFSAVTTLAGFAIGAFWGAKGVAISFFVTVALRLPLLFLVSSRGTPVRASDLAGAQFAPLVATLPAVALALWLRSILSIGPLLCLAIPLAYTCAIIGALATKEGRGALRAILGLAASLLDRGGGGKLRFRRISPAL